MRARRLEQLRILGAPGVALGSIVRGGLLALLSEQRAETLLLTQGFVAPGLSCPRCGRLSATGTSCPMDEAELQSQENIIDHAVKRPQPVDRCCV